MNRSLGDRGSLLRFLLLFALTQGCFDRGDRWLDAPKPVNPVCKIGEQRCTTSVERCQSSPSGAAWVTIDDCASQQKVCAPGLFQCTNCVPTTFSCEGQNIVQCRDDGSATDKISQCETVKALACQAGVCVNLCAQAAEVKSNVGCEYWAVDLDNADIDATSNAAAQQFAVVVSNPEPNVPVTVHILQDDTAPGTPGQPYEIATAVIAPHNLEVFKLGPREIDGSPAGQFNSGTNTALTRHAYRITSDFPVVAYQFNPLDNVAVFSNDASLLYPSEAYTYDGSALTPAYVALGWPQTIAITDDPDTNFDPAHPINLRATLTLVGTRPGTHVRITPATTVVAGGPVPKTGPGGSIEATLDAYDVLNLETGDFLADFTGSLIEADGPIAVFSGSEASDAPHFDKLSDRRCCADHLEDQLAPTRTAGTTFAVPHTPSRTRAVQAAGANVTPIPEPDFVRFLAVNASGAEVTTSLPPPDDHFKLDTIGSFHEIRAFGDFTALASGPVLVAQIMASQQACGIIQRGMPGGDPSLMMVPPLEQSRKAYVFLTPDKYAFDFVTIVAPTGAKVLMDGQLLGPDTCEVAPADGLTQAQRGGGDPTALVYRCQLGFPTIDPTVDPPLVSPGTQNDGVHEIVSDAQVFVSVMGFDSFVSYAYAAGTDLREIAPPQ